MNTLGIEAFLAVVQHGSLTGAANSLFLSQSTLSHRLAELEREIGMNLIDRGRGLRTLTLTDYGKEFLIVAKRWTELLQDTKNIKSRTKSLTLNIGAVDTIHTFVLPPLYQVLREHTSKINLSLKTDNSTELYLKVDRGEIDVAFALVDLPMRNIVTQKFYTESRVVLRKEVAPGNNNGFIKKESLPPDKEIFFQGDPVYHAWYERWRGAGGFPAICVDTAQLLMPLLNDYETWSIVPLCIAKKFVSMGALSYYRLEDEPPERTCYKIQLKYPRTSMLESLKLLDLYLEKFYTESFCVR